MKISTILRLLCVAAIAVTLASNALALSTANIPALPWEERSDWVNVKTAGAKGDGVQDDTAAIQAALNRMQDGVTIYFPPGIYRITQTLVKPTGRFLGLTLLGHGRDTILAWDGEAKGRMYWNNDGSPCSRYVGLTWDGRGKAAVGFDHSSTKYFETEIRHEYEAFRDFTEAGIRVGYKQNLATAETGYVNCLFENCGHGISLRNFNDLDHTMTQCEFRKCGTGIYSGKGSNFYARECHFEGSTETDIFFAGEAGSSIRRCTSQGSRQFVEDHSWVGPLTIQDCRVDGWSSPAGAVVLDGAPVVIFDCVFTRPPTKEAPVRLLVPATPEKAAVNIIDRGQRLVICNNQAQGSDALVKNDGLGQVAEVPRGTLKGVVKSAEQSFLLSKVRIPTKVFDVKRDFGAKGDGTTDDTAAIILAIGAARAYGKGAIAYLPAGKYVVRETLQLTGSNYYVGGSGYRTALIWRGKTGGTTIEISDPDRITLENIAVGHHDCGVGDNAIDIRQTGTGKPSFMCYDRVWTFGMYQMKPLERGLRLENLGKQDRVLFREVNGNLHITDSARATIFLELSYEGTILAQGKSTQRDGFLGGCVRLGTVTDPALWMKDNHSIVMSDFYVESSQHFVRLEGDNTLPPGRVTMGGAKFELIDSKNNGVEVNNYRGELAMGPYQFYVGNPLHHFVQQGEASFTMALWASCFYESIHDVKFSPAATWSVFSCYGVGTGPGKGQAIPNVSDPQQMLIHALEDLRRLGMVDRQMNEAWAK
ncbi:MAG: glycosyl hydrolase family 28-related protein [Armatimonadota bacterium]